MRIILRLMFISSVILAICDCSELNAQRDRDRTNDATRLTSMLRRLPVLVALDVNDDGELSAKEIRNASRALKSLDQNDDGKLTNDELRPEFGRLRGDDRPRGNRSRSDNAPKVGEMAPLFKLKSLDRSSETNLADFIGKKPVVLLFGSYT